MSLVISCFGLPLISFTSFFVGTINILQKNSLVNICGHKNYFKDARMQSKHPAVFASLEMGSLRKRISNRAACGPVVEQSRLWVVHRINLWLLTHVGASFISLAPTFLQKSERAHAAAPPFQTEPAALGFDLVLGVVLKAAAFILMRCANQKATTKSWLFDWNFCQPCIHDGKMPASVTLGALQVPGKDSGRGIPHTGG